MHIHAVMKPKAQVVDLLKAVVEPDRDLIVVQQIVPDTPLDAADSVSYRLRYICLTLTTIYAGSFLHACGIATGHQDRG